MLCRAVGTRATHTLCPQHPVSGLPLLARAQGVRRSPCSRLLGDGLSSLKPWVRELRDPWVRSDVRSSGREVSCGRHLAFAGQEGALHPPYPQLFGWLPALLSWCLSSFSPSSLMKNTKEKCASAQVWGAPALGMEK